MPPGEGVSVQGVERLVCGAEDEGGEVVPGGVGDPGVFFLGHLGADETSGVCFAEGADGTDVKEDVVVDGAWDEAVADGDGEVSRLRQFNAIGDLERDGVLKNGGGVARNEKQVTGGNGGEHFDVKGDGALGSREC